MIRSMKFEIEKYQFGDDGVIPNSELPVLVYRQVCTAEDKSDWFEATFIANRWTNNWRDTILSYHHFHSTTHEVLGVGQGAVRLQIGGSSGVTLTVVAGDMIVLPAGVGHCSLPGQGDYEIVGGYPDGASWDLLTGTEAERRAALPRIKGVPIPVTDPIEGIEGVLIKYWT
ncbi:cupin [Dyadobacter pollutisoli]|uniref:Cupin n=1 Tax=Dyadobacter pollutisoli TaxID=2910158 RepID=A0A9E8NCY3_9BACT|nr:cupin [Dyadobacter pollutisoli]WAC13018.1 cupin [Dyadobacter pollutisoli]